MSSEGNSNIDFSATTFASQETITGNIVVDHVLPQLSLVLSNAASSDDDISDTEHKRLRVGCLSPTEIGVVLDYYFSFGKWMDMARYTMSLKHGYVLSLDGYIDSSLLLSEPSGCRNKWVSPLDLFLDRVEGDVYDLVVALDPWALNEATSAFEVLFNKQSFLTLYEKDMANWKTMYDNIFNEFDKMTQSMDIIVQYALPLFEALQQFAEIL